MEHIREFNKNRADRDDVEHFIKALRNLNFSDEEINLFDIPFEKRIISIEKHVIYRQIMDSFSCDFMDSIQRCFVGGDAAMKEEYSKFIYFAISACIQNLVIVGKMFANIEAVDQWIISFSQNVKKKVKMIDYIGDDTAVTG